MLTRLFFTSFLFILIISGCQPEPSKETQLELSPQAKSFIQDAFAPFAGDTLVDNHVHIVGLGNSNSGIEIHTDMQSMIHPFKLTRFNYFLDAAGVVDKTRADEEYLEQLIYQIVRIPVHFQILGLALDRHYLENGAVDQAETEIYIPNQYIVDLWHQYPDRIQPAVSIHPYRKDAVLELEKWATQGVHVVKWIPNAMGIDPSSALCDPFYAAMRRLNMVLLSHAGTEQAIASQGRQHLGNPLLLRSALKAGVKVIVAHCAVAGKSVDLDDPKQAKMDNFKLFMRLFDDPQYEGLLFADISAMTLINQIGEPLKVMLSRTDLHSRLLYGSDYPLPAVDILNNNTALSYLGYLDDESLSALEEIQLNNPLLYNFVLMRSLKHPESGQQFSEDLFRNRLPW
ncbi:MAG: amidohydrolase family protein [Candidatus Marinimicrobia bacterium]|nr:amidohydrolase family protein [Candidatus Neomarinimicrobiota bacterium]